MTMNHYSTPPFLRFLLPQRSWVAPLAPAQAPATAARNHAPKPTPAAAKPAAKIDDNDADADDDDGGGGGGLVGRVKMHTGPLPEHPRGNSPLPFFFGVYADMRPSY